jgi:hypothetical protein
MIPTVAIFLLLALPQCHQAPPFPPFTAEQILDGEPRTGKELCEELQYTLEQDDSLSPGEVRIIVQRCNSLFNRPL